MLTESFIAATETVKPPSSHLAANLKDVGIFYHELQPQAILRGGFKKSSSRPKCVTLNETHVFAAQVDKAVVNVYSRDRSNQEATIPFPQKISCLTYAHHAAILIIGTVEGRLYLWEIATGRVTSSSASHIEPVTDLVVTADGGHILSASLDSSIHLWHIGDLVAFEPRHDNIGTSSFSKDPVSTFSQHRSPIKALAVSRSQSLSTAFVVSASEDKICYIWQPATLEVLRTILLVNVPTCVVLDPADRSAYLGSANGTIQHVAIVGESKHSILDAAGQDASIPVQLDTNSLWEPPSAANLGAALCVTMSYDGMTLISGHYSGSLLRWDVAKHRVANEITGLSGQAVTNVVMLGPHGFMNSVNHTEYALTNIVKPRLELSNDTEFDANVSIPSEYTLYAQITRASSSLESSDIDFSIFSDGFGGSLLETAVAAVTSHKATADRQNGSLPSIDLYKIDKLEDEVRALRAQAESRRKLEETRLQRHLERMKKRDAVGLRKRQAFFAAKKAGANGDEAMKPFYEQAEKINAESDEEALAESHANGTNENRDVVMNG